MGVNKVVYGGNTLIDLSADTVAANKMLAGITGHDKAGNPITGNIPSQAAQTITPGTADKTIAAGKYLSGKQTIKGDANLVAGNIKSGVSIFGVAGNYEGSGGGSGGGGSVETCTVRIYSTDGLCGLYSYGTTTVAEDGSITNQAYGTGMDIGYENFDLTFENVVVGSVLILSLGSLNGYLGAECSNAEFYFQFSTWALALLTITAPSGGTATIRFYDDD